MTETAPAPGKNGKKKRMAFAIFTMVVIIGLVAGLWYRGYSRAHLRTDDAFVKGAIHLVASRVPGTVSMVRVTNNQRVRAGEELVDLDDDVYVQRLAEAQGGLQSEKEKPAELRAQVHAQDKRVLSARASLKRTIIAGDELKAVVAVRYAEIRAKQAVKDMADIDLARAQRLLAEGVIPRDRYDRARTGFEAAAAALQAAKKQKEGAAAALRAHASTVLQAKAALNAEEAVRVRVRQSIKGQKGQIQRREAQVELARLNLSYTKITSPVDGFVTKKSVEVGNQVQAGQPLLAVVSLKEAYIVANYKETQLHLIKPGQRVRFRLDAYPEKRFDGRVDSIMVGTGAAFSLFPPENASGNYVKVVQRIPVKMVFDNIREVIPYLRVGMSVVPTILTSE